METPDFESYLQHRKLSPATISSYLYAHQAFTGWLAAEAIPTTGFSYNDLLGFIRHLSAGGKSREQVNHYLSIVRHYCTCLIQNGQRTDNPAASIQLKGISRKLPGHLLGMEELETVFSQYQLQLQEKANRKIMLGLLIYQGLTTDEIIRLRPQDVRADEGKIFIGGTRKTNERLLPLQAAQMTMLQAYLKASKFKTGALLQEETKGVESVHYIRNQVAQLFRRARQLNPNVINSLQIRNSVITHWLKQHSLRQVQYLAGHKYVSSTERYQTNNLDDLTNELARHHPGR